MTLVKNSNLKGISDYGNKANPFTVLTGVFLTPISYQFASKTSYATEADWLTAIAAGNIFPLQGIKEQESIDVEDGELDTSTGDKVFLWKGKRGKIIRCILPFDLHKALTDYSFNAFRMFKLDLNNNILGTTPDDIAVQGFRLSYFRVLKLADPSSDTPAYSTVMYQEAIPDEMDVNGYSVRPSWLASDLEGVLQVTLTAGATSSNSVTVTVAYVDESDGGSTGVDNSYPVTGLLAANFKGLTDAGAAVASPAVTESSTTPGTYDFSATVLTTNYTLQIIASSVNLYKSSVVTLT